MKKQLKQVVLITGASSGIGKATAIMFAKNGYSVYGVARRNFEIEGVNTVLGDVTSVDDAKRIIEYVTTREGRLDIIVNNAGWGISGSVEFSDPEDVKKLFDVNFMGAVNFNQQALPIFRKQKCGKIINISSVGSFIPLPYQAFYSATKAALDAYAKALRAEVKPFGILPFHRLYGQWNQAPQSCLQQSSQDRNQLHILCRSQFCYCRGNTHSP